MIYKVKRENPEKYWIWVQCFDCKDVRKFGINDPKLISSLTEKNHVFDPCPICRCGFARYFGPADE